MAALHGKQPKADGGHQFDNIFMLMAAPILTFTQKGTDD
jgi:hypothetical protein